MAEVPTYPIAYQAGDSMAGLSWTWRTAGGTPRDLSGYSCELLVYDAKGNAVLQLTDGAGLVLDGPGGKVSVNASPAQLSVLDPGVLVYLVSVTSSDQAIRRTLSKGPFRIDALPRA